MCPELRVRHEQGEGQTRQPEQARNEATPSRQSNLGDLGVVDMGNPLGDDKNETMADKEACERQEDDGKDLDAQVNFVGEDPVRSELACDYKVDVDWNQQAPDADDQKHRRHLPGSREAFQLSTIRALVHHDHLQHGEDGSHHEGKCRDA